ncbi:hypothetical protein D3C75_135680 [compost metagenome]
MDKPVFDVKELADGDIVTYVGAEAYLDGKLSVGIVRGDDCPYEDGVTVYGPGWRQYVNRFMIVKVERPVQVLFADLKMFTTDAKQAWLRSEGYKPVTPEAHDVWSKGLPPGHSADMGYFTYYKDRPRREGGGLMMYTQDYVDGKWEEYVHEQTKEETTTK